MTATLDHINLTVRDFREAVEWYGRVFGFELVEEGVQDGVTWGVIRSGSSMLCIYEYGDSSFEAGKPRREAGFHAINHFALRIEDVETWLKTLEREKLEVLYGGKVEWPHSDAWYVTDPTGWEIEVVHWRGGIAFG
ncbi:MAG: VOC family protein [Nitrospira sp.]|nr:VOC family protein [Nitrospira sp.]